MGFLGNLLPGLRDLRAPLSAGYLWLLAIWLYFAPRLPTSIDQANGVVRNLYWLASITNRVFIGIALSFCAYLFGILSIGVLSGITSLFGQLLAVFFVPVILLLNRSNLGFSEKRSVEKATNFSEFFQPTKRRARMLVMHRIAKSFSENDESFYTGLDHVISSSPEHYIKQREQLDQKGWRTFSKVLFANSITWLMPGVSGDLTSVPVTNRLRTEPELSTVALKNKVTTAREEGDELTIMAFVATVVDVARHARDLLEELDLVPERLVGSKPATYDRYDRLKAEGEFRQAVVPPLYAVIVALVLRGTLSLGHAFWLVLAVCVVLYQGVLRERDAQAQLIQALQAGIEEIPELARLKTTNLYWISEPQIEASSATQPRESPLQVSASPTSDSRKVVRNRRPWVKR